MCYCSYVKSSVSCLTAQINRGYIAPEYVIHGQLSEKVDTYSFGIVVLEIISGRRGANLKKEAAGSSSLLEHASKILHCTVNSIFSAYANFDFHNITDLESVRQRRTFGFGR